MLGFVRCAEGLGADVYTRSGCWCWRLVLGVEVIGGLATMTGGEMVRMRLARLMYVWFGLVSLVAVGSVVLV